MSRRLRPWVPDPRVLRERPAPAPAPRESIAGWALRLGGLLLMLLAMSLPLLRTPDRPVESLVADWAPPPSDFIDLDGQLVHVRDEGPKASPLPPVLLLHGVSASLHTWSGWARVLRRERRVISLDLPAYGLTGPWTGAFAGQPYSGEAYARFVLRVLDRLHVPQVVVAGNSLGGEVAWRMAQLAPQRVQALVLVDAAGYRFTPEAIPLGWRLARLPVLGQVVTWFTPVQAVAQGLRSVVGDPAVVTPAMVRRYHELALRSGNREALVARAQAWSDQEGVEHVTGVRQPTLVLWGGRDRVIPPALAERFVADIPGARLQRFPALGHIPQEEDPTATVSPVLDFLHQLPAPVGTGARPATAAASASPAASAAN